MQRFLGPWLAVFALSLGQAAERVIDFAADAPEACPSGFRSALSGGGKPGDWRVILDAVAPQIAPLTPNAPAVAKRPVVAQLSRDPTDERFPLLIFEEEVLGDFTLTCHFKLVAGAVEQMAGVAFRLQDTNNYYVVRASALANTFRFYRVADGHRDLPVSVETEVSKDVWHELGIDCKGNRIRVSLDGRRLLPEITDNSYAQGKLALWTKSDSVSYFRDLRLSYAPRETLAQVLVRDMLRKYPRLLGLRIYAASAAQPALAVVASNDPKDLHLLGGQAEKDCVANNAIFYGKAGQRVLLTMPLHDRNGEAVAAARFSMTSFPGQTEQNAIGRALPIMKAMEARIRSLKELLE